MAKKNDPGAPPELRFFAQSDYGLAERLVHVHGEDLRYCWDEGSWLVWDGRIWRRDTKGEVVRRAKSTVRMLFEEAKGLDDTRLQAFARKSESRGQLSAMISLAESEPGIPVVTQELDQNPWHFGCRNGVLDLETGHLLKHNREQLITKASPIAFDADAQCPAWLDFLDRIFAGDKALIRVVQRAVGYSMTASTQEHALFILHGSGANGKSTFLSVVQKILGDYAITTAPGMLAARRSERHPVEIADLLGVRMGISHEWGAGKSFDEELLKQLTGGDKLKGRYMRENFFEFTATHKLWIATNHLPRVKQSDYGIWRRLKLIPFLVTIPEAERDPRLLEKLLAEAPGILAWMVEGCVEWMKFGLGDTEVMQRAREEYKTEMDILAPFVQARLVEQKGAAVDARVVYQAYQEWAREVGEQVQSANWLSRRLKERGYQQRRRGGGWMQWIDVKVVQPLPPSLVDGNPTENLL